MGCPFRDIPRVRPDRSQRRNRDLTRYIEPAFQRGLTDVLIADPRNDANVILSQMTALSIICTTAFSTCCRSATRWCHAASKWEAAHERYLCARSAVTLIYRNVIRKDLMKRCSIPKIYEAYQKAKFASLDRHSRGSSGGVDTGRKDGAYRWNSRTVRSASGMRWSGRNTRSMNANQGRHFPLNLVIGQDFGERAANMPLDRTWIVIQWSNFFEHRRQPSRI